MLLTHAVRAASGFCLAIVGSALIVCSTALFLFLPLASHAAPAGAIFINEAQPAADNTAPPFVP